MYYTSPSSFYLPLFKMLVLMTDVGSAQFIPITITYKAYLNRIYLLEWNPDPPSPMDPATTNANARLQICEDINRTYIFDSLYDVQPVTDMRGVNEELQQPQYFDIFHHLYDPRPPHEYTNLYTYHEVILKVQSTNTIPRTYSSVHKGEYVFVCLLREMDVSLEDWTSDEDSDDEEDGIREEDPRRKKEINTHIVPFYVSKMYNLHRGLHAHRFVFSDHGLFKDFDIIIAEQPAKPCTKPDFNIELHYLELRKYHLPATSREMDPVCVLYEDQLMRLCTVILSSSYFEDQEIVSRARRTVHGGCSLKEIGFKTDEARQIIADESNPFVEYTLRCYANLVDGSTQKFHISRAYNPNQVFVYVKNPDDGKLYLEVLLADVGIVHERYNFGQIEI